MKKIVLILALALSITACGKSEKEIKPAKQGEIKEQPAAVAPNNSETSAIKWYSKLEDAQVEAQKSGKYIFVHFTGSDWCKWCIKLDHEVYQQDAFQNYADSNLVMVKFDFPQNQDLITKEQASYNQQMMKMFGVQGFPSVFVLDKDMKPIGRTGYQDGGPDAYVSHLQDMIASKK